VFLNVKDAKSRTGKLKISSVPKGVTLSEAGFNQVTSDFCCVTEKTVKQKIGRNEVSAKDSPYQNKRVKT
jgi:hypothetical protein